MPQDIPFLYQEVREILEQEVSDRRRTEEILKENRRLVSGDICSMDKVLLRSKLSSLVDRWNKDLLSELYVPRIKQGISDFFADNHKEYKQLPPYPSLPSGYKDYKELKSDYEKYVKIKKSLDESIRSLRSSSAAIRNELVRYFIDSYKDTVRSRTNTAESAFTFFIERIGIIYEKLPKDLYPFVYIAIGVIDEKNPSDRLYDRYHTLNANGTFDFVPDFSYTSNPKTHGFMTKFEVNTSKLHKPSLSERLAGLPKKAEEWVKEQEVECKMIDTARLLVNTLRILGGDEKCLRIANQKIATLGPVLEQYNERKRQYDALDKEYHSGDGIKGTIPCGQFVAKKGKMHRAEQKDLDRIRERYATELRKYGLYECDLDDIRWPEFVAPPEKVKNAREALVNRLLQNSIERSSQDASRRQKLTKEMNEINGHEHYLVRLQKLQECDPVLVQVLVGNSEQVQTMKERAASREKVPFIPTGQTCPHPKDKDVLYPEMVPWHSEGKASNICLELKRGSGKEKEEQVYKVLDNLLFNMLMAFPPGRVNLHFVDFNLSGRGNFFLQNFDNSVTGSSAISDEASFRDLLTKLQAKVTAVGTLTNRYDVVVILDAPKHFSGQHAHALQPLCENGYKGGVSFVVVDTGNRTQGDGSALFAHKSFHHVQLSEEPMMYDTIFNTHDVRKMCLEQFGEGMEEAKRTPELKFDIEASAKKEFKESSRGIRVPVGSTGDQSFEFRLDQESHPHAFVLGQSGSGKSVFLRDVILGAALQYAPEDLQLYLLDLKAGGIEFNGYEILPHTKAVLLDDSDRQIILEILRDVSRELDSRGERIRNASRGLVSLEDYNRAFPSERLSQILIIVDECQRLFSDRPDSIQKEISSIMDKIAEMGRAFGIHLVLATQTLHGSVISAKVRKNISDFYLLKGGMADGLERLMEESSALTTGQVIYTNRGEKSLFQAFYLDGESKDKAIETACKKAFGHSSNGQFVFTGDMTFNLRPEDADMLRNSARRGLACIAGREITVGLEPLVIKLRADMSENILVIGSKASSAVSLALQSYIGMMLSDQGTRRTHKFYAIDCQDDPEMDYYSTLDAIEAYGSHLVSGNARGELISSLANQVRNGTAEPTVILMLSQERFRPLVLDAELPGKPTDPVQEPSQTTVPAFLQAGTRSASFSSSRKLTYRSELAYLLEHGSEQGIHFIWEVDRLPNLLADANISRQSLMRMFRHILMLRSVPDSVLRLGLPSEVDPDKLNDKEGRVRAWWIDMLDNRFRLFTPLRNSRPDEMDDLFKV